MIAHLKPNLSRNFVAADVRRLILFSAKEIGACQRTAGMVARASPPVRFASCQNRRSQKHTGGDAHATTF